MQKLEEVEHGFISRVVDSAKKIVNGNSPAFEKIAKLQFAAAEHVRKARHLLTLFESPRLSDKRRSTIQRIVALRLRSATYIRHYAETLRSHEGGKHSLRQVPRTFSEPRWQQREDSKQKLGRQPEITFMEFSS